MTRQEIFENINKMQDMLDEMRVSLMFPKRHKRPQPNIEEISPLIVKMNRAMGISLNQLSSTSRQRYVTDRRYILIHQLRTIGFTLETIAELINRNHTTLLNSLRKYKDYYKHDPKFALLADRIENIKVTYLLKNESISWLQK